MVGTAISTLAPTLLDLPAFIDLPPLHQQATRFAAELLQYALLFGVFVAMARVSRGTMKRLQIRSEAIARSAGEIATTLIEVSLHVHEEP